MITIKNLGVYKGRKQIIKDVSFEVCPARISVIVGKNGAGKSTLLEAIASGDTKATGTIRWDLKSMEQLGTKDLAYRRAVLSQHTEVAFSLPVHKLVEMGTYASEQVLPTEKIKALVHQALSEVNMLDFAYRNFNTLSGGERKRVLLAKCIVQLNCCHWSDVSKYLFLDEPTASLDIEQQFNFIELVKRLVKRRNIGVLAVLHDLNLAAQFADEILMLKDGQLFSRGTPKEVLTKPKLLHVFGIYTIIKPHPVLDCLHITTLPKQFALQPFTNLAN
ncbi:MAG: ATP-binding cassette domain-containing protein [Bacteroidota bacterium]